MKHEKRLVRDTILYGIAHFGASFLSLLMLPILTRYFHPAEFGTWDLVLTSVSLLAPIISLEMTSATYRWLLEEDEEEKRKTIITTGFLQIIRQLIIFNIACILIFAFWKFPFQSYALIFMNVNIISSFLMQCVRGLRKNVLFATLSLLQSIFVIGMLLTFIFILKLRVESFFYAHILANILIIVIVLFGIRFTHYIQLRKNFSSILVKQYFSYAFPIIPAAISWWIMTMSDRWFILYFIDINANGIYAISLKIAAVLMMVNNVFSLAWKDNVITTFKLREKERFYNKVFILYFRLLAASVILLTLLAKPLINSFIGESYSDAWQYAGILLLATLYHALALFWSSSFHAARKTKAILQSTVIGAILNVLFNLLLTPSFGLYGVAVATVIAFFITWLIRVYLAKQLFNINLRIREFVAWNVLIIVSIGITFL